MQPHLQKHYTVEELVAPLAGLETFLPGKKLLAWLMALSRSPQRLMVELQKKLVGNQVFGCTYSHRRGFVEYCVVDIDRLAWYWYQMKSGQPEIEVEVARSEVGMFRLLLRQHARFVRKQKP